jgi:acrylyl-CoA reductase (NADPH)
MARSTAQTPWAAPPSKFENRAPRNHDDSFKTERPGSLAATRLPGNFTALLAVGKQEKYAVDFRQLTTRDLPEGEVLVQVLYSSLNYKDGLAVAGRGKIIQRFPMICGIDLAGRVLESSSPQFTEGQEVFATGQGLGTTHWGGYSQRARLSASSLLPLPAGLSLEQSMALGTAGFTAMLGLMALEKNGVRPSQKTVLVTGAGGGVGSLSVVLLTAKGYKVAASTGRPELGPYLRNLGAATILDRSELEREAKPLAPVRWLGAIDTVGGQTLSTVIAATAPQGAVVSTGLAGASRFATTVFPFILRSISLVGVTSGNASKPLRSLAWSRLALEIPMSKLKALTNLAPLSGVKPLAEEILLGKVRGRTVIDVNA